MKILRLRLAGFGPYKNEELVNFEQFDDDGIFLISGKTGAGKSSILDAICFALYNQVPRFDGAELRLRSDHCEPGDPTFVELDFSINEVRYRLRRSPAYDRPKKNGNGVTKALPTAVLHVFDGDDWRGLAAKLVTVGHELSDILPLKVDQFLQVILLAQNRFQRFLLAKTEERRIVLRTLFSTGRFDQLETGLILRRKALQEQVSFKQRDLSESQAAAKALLHQEVAGASDISDAVVESSGSGIPTAQWFAHAQRDLTAQRDAANALVALSDVDVAAATSRHEACVSTRQHQLRRSRALVEMATLDAREANIREEREHLEAAERAARVWPAIGAERTALLARELAEKTLLSARAERQVVLGQGAQAVAAAAAAAAGAGADAGAAGAGAGVDVEPSLHLPANSESLPQVEAECDRLVGHIGALTDALAEEFTLPALDDQIAALCAVENERASVFKSAHARLAELPEHIEALTVEHSATLLLAARHADTTIALERAERALEAAHTVDRLSTALFAAQRVELAASGDNVAAAARYEAVLSRRFSGFASELARRLVSGDACSVCGSTDHPEPARGEQEPVTPHDLEVARDGVTDRQGQLATAQKNVQSVDLRLAEARALAGAAELSEHLATRDAATKTHERASQALALLPRLEDQLAQRRNDITEQTAQLESARNDVDSAVAEHAASTARRATIAKKLVTQRGPFASVHERVTGLKAQLRVTRAVVAALYARNQRLAEYDSCQSSLQANLREHGFDTATAAQAARIESSEVTLRVQALRLHDDALAAARATLADPELASLPEDLVDLEPSQFAVGTASARRDDALTRHSSLLDRTLALDGIVSRVTTLLAATGSLHTSYQQVRELADVVHGDEPNTKRMRLENYVLAAQLEQIVHAANVRLGTMTSGRYALEHDDSLAFGGARSGLGLVIRDEYTGRARATHSLSGGETFLASLALALGLAEVVTAQAGGVTLDTLFVDEGFGSLDGETLETAMSTLDSLRAGGRTIGLISHVDSMKEQIPATLRIEVTDRGFSRINADRSDA